MGLPPLVNPALGYNPTDYPNGMVYNVWKETFGKYRWYHEDGTARVIFPLDYNWQAIYDVVTDMADTEFDFWIIQDVPDFTSNFLSEVGTNWLKYKTMLEMMSGELTGYTISPDVFTAGFTRKTDGWVNDDYGKDGWANDDYHNNETYSGNGVTDTTSNRDTTTTADTKARSINYVQGIQAYDNSLNNSNIGEFGNDYASSMNDTVTFSNGTENVNTTGNTDETVSANTDITGGNENKYGETGNNRNTYGEVVQEERINFYDNLAFLRERIDRLNTIVPFSDYFKHLFQNVTSIRGYY